MERQFMEPGAHFHDSHQQLMVEATRNGSHDIAKLANFNKFCPLSPSVEDLPATWASLLVSDQEVGY